jgi:hypothetical protein
MVVATFGASVHDEPTGMRKEADDSGRGGEVAARWLLWTCRVVGFTVPIFSATRLR